MDTATSFSNHIKPYFTPCYRAHMIKGFDLWDYDSVKSRYSEIGRVSKMEACLHLGVGRANGTTTRASSS